MRYCENCGSPLKDDARFCTECGARVAPPASAEETRVPEAEPASQNVSAGDYAQPAEDYARPAENYTQPAGGYTQPAGGYTRPAGSYTLPGGPVPPQPGREKKKLKPWAIVLIVIGALLVLAAAAAVVLFLLLGLRTVKGGSVPEDSAYIGSWTATGYRMGQTEVDAASVGESTMTLNADGTAELKLMGQEIPQLGWKETDDGVSLYAGSVSYDAQMEDGLLVMDVSTMDILFSKQGSGLSDKFAQRDAEKTAEEKETQESAETAADTQEPSATDTSADALTAAQRQWSGDWYGSLWISQTYGDTWADYQDMFIDFYGYISVDENGDGWLDANDEPITADTDSVMMSMYIQADADHFEQVGTEAWFSDMEIVQGKNGLEYTCYPVEGNPNVFKIDAHYTDPDIPDGSGGFDFEIIFVRWGCEWDYNVDSVAPPGYDDYLAQIGG